MFPWKLVSKGEFSVVMSVYIFLEKNIFITYILYYFFALKKLSSGAGLRSGLGILFAMYVDHAASLNLIFFIKIIFV